MHRQPAAAVHRRSSRDPPESCHPAPRDCDAWQRVWWHRRL